MAGTYQFTALRVLIVVAGSLVLGGAAGGRLALMREQSRLEHNKALVRRTHAEVWSKHNRDSVIQVINAIYSPRFIHANELDGDDSSGIAGVIKAAIGDNPIPDWSERQEDMVAEGDLVADRFFSTGTQAGDIAGVATGGRKIRLPAMEMYRVVDDKLVEQWDYNDTGTIWSQLGLIDPNHWGASAVCGNGRGR
jgi:predicted ester cyclase